MRLATSPIGNAVKVGSRPILSSSFVHCRKALIALFVPGSRRICPWVAVSVEYVLKSPSSLSSVLSLHDSNESSNMSSANLSAAVSPLYNVVSFTPHAAKALRTVNVTGTIGTIG